MINTKSICLTLGLSFSFLLAGCGNEDAPPPEEEDTVNYSEEVEYSIIGIEPGSGTMDLANKTLEEYDNLEGWNLLDGATVGMLTTLGEAIDNEEPVIVTGWTPHWKFAQYDLKFLDNPKETFGGSENINTITRKGLEEDMPNAFTILDRFYWEPEQMQEVMLAAQDVSFKEAADNWVNENEDLVAEWTEGVDQVDGKSIELVSTPWDTERSSSHVMQAILEQQGFNVKITPVDPAVMFQAIANSEADATLSPWLPATHASYYERYKEDFVDLGENLTGAKIGFVVPDYMDIDSIEDLEPNN
ncbi:glycine betaine ABC transporter substrate-binding protein [Aquibacillus sediminis]|uniref:glycine betaine ABC transporter substrate-binding protein n=1 Tax=Aquibacillus sediminis TaxID=2574734 RepID=UPI00110881FD|nr:glycine betaine ABC transporter substrate-binding protein [Aquibacillus sediminis]